ncbi:peptidoglycan hydrolase-like protein with peptidoglycan-binding domain [Nakamurella flavida]|nr:peptidoglycan-binding protein [Nakamurella flavida]MDP9779102.1 peptidoglycan hydrolase-like protein with peptidoglycan-binding domain [Nakamurella flavida]
MVAAIGSLAATALFVGGGTASADPSADDWYQLRMCESTNRYDINTGNGYYGAYQFDLSTWRSVGGSGYPHEASATEQDYRALILYRNRGWSPWVCAGLVGLSEDGDARSKVQPPVPGNQGGGGGSEAPSDPAPAADPAPTNGAPAYPGRQFRLGDSSEELKSWQRQMGALGYGLTGTGYFGPNTQAAVLALQEKAGLNVVGYIGPKTWAAAWAAAPAPAPAAAPATGYVPASDEACQVGTGSAPAWPERQFVEGDTARELQCFQRQLGSRGYGLTGTGYYGDATKAAVVAFQQSQGINPSGIIGQRTWVAAWQG